MTDKTDIVNLALQSFGTRTTVTAAELAANSTNEAIQANLTYENTRDGLLRMAPWDCALKTDNLVYITSVPGTPENTSPATNLWQPGQPRPPWAYEYQYPVDCLRACWIIPAIQSSFAGGIPINTAVTGGASNWYGNGPIPFKVAIDTFICVVSATTIIFGINYAIGDIIYGARDVSTVPPTGAPVALLVTNVNGIGEVTGFSVISQVPDASPPLGGSYFNIFFATNQTQGSTTGSGTGFRYAPLVQRNCDQRVILTNQQYATLVYVRQVTDPNVWDPLFQDAMQNALGADLCMALTGDKTLANLCIQRANNSILEARKADGNEGLTVNDTTPDWIQARGVTWGTSTYDPAAGFNWGGLLPSW